MLALEGVLKLIDKRFNSQLKFNVWLALQLNLNLVDLYGNVPILIPLNELWLWMNAFYSCRLCVLMWAIQRQACKPLVIKIFVDQTLLILIKLNFDMRIILEVIAAFHNDLALVVVNKKHMLVPAQNQIYLILLILQ